MNKQKLYVIIAAGVGVVSAFLPWVTVNIMGLSASVNGIEGDGKITLIAFAVAIGLCFATPIEQAIKKEFQYGIGVAGALAFVIALLAMFSIKKESEGLGHIGFGVYLTIIAALAVVFLGLLGPIREHLNKNAGDNKFLNDVKNLTDKLGE